MPTELPEWFVKDPFIERRLVALGLNPCITLHAMTVLGFSPSLQRVTALGASAAELSQIADHAAFLEELFNEKEK